MLTRASKALIGLRISRGFCHWVLGVSEPNAPFWVRLDTACGAKFAVLGKLDTAYGVKWPLF